MPIQVSGLSTSPLPALRVCFRAGSGRGRGGDSARRLGAGDVFSAACGTCAAVVHPPEVSQHARAEGHSCRAMAARHGHR